MFVTAVLRFAICAPTPAIDPELFTSIPRHLPTTHQLWLSRIMLQTIWRWSHAYDPTVTLNSFVVESIGRTLRAGDGQILAILKTNSFLTVAISLGLRVDIRDLYPPNDKCVTSLSFFYEIRS